MNNANLLQLIETEVAVRGSRGDLDSLEGRIRTKIELETKYPDCRFEWRGLHFKITLPAEVKSVPIEVRFKK